MPRRPPRDCSRAARNSGWSAAAVLEYLADHPRPGIRAAWLTRRRDLIAELRARGHVAHHVWSPAGVWWSLRSGVAIYDSTPHDLNFWLSRGTRRVLLRHGIGFCFHSFLLPFLLMLLLLLLFVIVIVSLMNFLVS